MSLRVKKIRAFVQEFCFGVAYALVAGILIISACILFGLIDWWLTR